MGRINKAVVLGMVSLALAGCGVGLESSDETKAQQARDAKTLSDLYSTVEGRWTGNLSLSVVTAAGIKVVPAELLIYKVFVNDGSNPDGTQKLRPSLRARFRPIDQVTETDTLLLTGDFDKTNTLILTSLGGGSSAGVAGGAGGASGAATGAASGGATSSSDHFLSLVGGVEGSVTKLNVTLRGGKLGDFTGQKTSNTILATLGGDVDDIRARSLKILSRYEGEYRGTLTSPDGLKKNISLKLAIAETLQAGGYLLPGLVARYHDLADETLMTDWNLYADLNTLAGSIAMSGARTGALGTVTFSVTGKLDLIENKNQSTLRIFGDVRSKSEYLGQLVVFKKR